MADQPDKEPEVYKLVCKTCGKVIASLSKSQAQSNMRIHMMTHEKHDDS